MARMLGLFVCVLVCGLLLSYPSTGTQGYYANGGYHYNNGQTTVFVPLFSYHALAGPQQADEPKEITLSEEALDKLYTYFLNRLMKEGYLKATVDPTPVQPKAVKKVEDPFLADLRGSCGACHGPVDPKGKLTILDAAGRLNLKLTREQRWDLWDRASRDDGDEGRMPPMPRAKLSPAHLQRLKQLAQRH